MFLTISVNVKVYKISEGINLLNPILLKNIEFGFKFYTKKNITKYLKNLFRFEFVSFSNLKTKVS